MYAPALLARFHADAAPAFARVLARFGHAALELERRETCHTELSCHIQQYRYAIALWHRGVQFKARLRPGQLQSFTGVNMDRAPIDCFYGAANYQSAAVEQSDDIPDTEPL